MLAMYRSSSHMRKASPNTKGFALVELLIVVAVLVAVGAIGFYAYHRSHKTKTVASDTASHQSSTNQNTQTPPADPYAGWKQYCSAQEKSCFKYPADWTTKDIGASDPAGDGLQITSPSGTLVWFQSAVSGLGGSCGDPDPVADHTFIHKVIASLHVGNLYIVESGTEDTTNHIALVNGSDGQAPKTGDTGSCVPPRTFASRHDPSMYAWLESNGVSNFKAVDLSTAELILKSYSY